MEEPLKCVILNWEHLEAIWKMLENTYNKETMMKYLEVQRKSVLYNQQGKKYFLVYFLGLFYCN